MREGETETRGNERECFCLRVGEEDGESLIESKIKAERNVSEKLSPSSGKRLALQSVVKIN